MTQAVDRRKSVLITGCSTGGIGNALAREFHRSGLRVFATARKTEEIEDLAELGIETLSLVVDDEISVKECYAEVHDRVGDKGLDYLVNNAGRNYTVPAIHVDLSEARLTFEVNFFAVIRMCQVFLPLLLKSKGTIVQIGSVAGVMPYVFGSVYNASKSALHQFSDTLRIELAPFGVKVVTIVTGGVQSNIARTERKLPSDSIYLPINAEYERRVVHSQHNAMSHNVYAKSVVKQVLYGPWPWRWLWPWRTNPRPWIWEGHFSHVVRFLVGGWLWCRLFDRYFTSAFKLHKLRGTNPTR